MERKVNINNIKKTLDIIYGTSQKVYELKANANDMNTEDSRQYCFLNLEKQRGAQNTIKKLFTDDKKITDEKNI